MAEPLKILFEDGASVALSHLPEGAVRLEARSSLGPTVTAMDIPLNEVEQIRKWLGKHDAAHRGERARNADR